MACKPKSTTFFLGRISTVSSNSAVAALLYLGFGRSHLQICDYVVQFARSVEGDYELFSSRRYRARKTGKYSCAFVYAAVPSLVKTPTFYFVRAAE